MGQIEYRLQSLADDALLAGLSNVVRRRNSVTSEMLAYLAEVDERRLYLGLGFPSLFEYCVEALGMCESTAGRHIAAARVCRAHPELFAMVASSELHASALSLMKKHLTAENAAEPFVLCTRKSARKVEELLAARFPRPNVPDAVRRLPVREGATPNVESPEEAQKSRRLEPLSADRFGVHFTADGEFRELLERVRGLAGHRLPSGELMTLMKRGLEAYERELLKERFAVGRKPRARRAPRTPRAAPRSEITPLSEATTSAKRTLSNPELPAAGPPLSRAVPTRTGSLQKRRRASAAVAREVFVRDGGQCTFVAPDGRRCRARQCLELDHIEPWAVGGEDTIENLRMRCRAHNQEHARQYFGAEQVRAAIARKRREETGLKRVTGTLERADESEAPR